MAVSHAHWELGSLNWQFRTEPSSCKVNRYNGGVAGIVSDNSTGTYGNIALTDITNVVEIPEALPVYDIATCVSKYEADVQTIAANAVLA